MLNPADLVIRPLHSTEEYNTYFRLATTAFAPQPSEEAEQSWQRSIRQSPDFRTERIRGVFRAGEQVGGYMVYNRVLCMGAARLSTGCIGAAVTAPQARKQGAASAMMQDALVFARKHGHALLLLDGVPNFYRRFGYVDVFDVTTIEVDRSALLAQPASAYRVRPAIREDAPALLALYQRHFGAYSGSFERSLEIQLHRLLNGRLPLLVALSPQGAIEGYLLHGKDEEMAQGRELAVDNWDALLALLHYHAHLFDEEAAPTSLLYFLPHEAPMTHWLIDTLQIPDTSQWGSPALEWGVRGLSYHHRFAGWMGCLTDFPLLLTSLLPEFQTRWQRSLAHWTGEISLTVDGQTCVIHLDGAEVRLAEASLSAPARLELTPQALVQLVFGYRPLSGLADISHLSADARSVLAILFPAEHTWIPCSDWF